MTDFIITLECGDCDGTGSRCDRDDMDPSARDITCYVCDGSGYTALTDWYECIEDCKADYEDALSIRADK